MNILLLGSGGRENALAWKIAQSPLLSQLYIAPGNPGTSAYGKNVDLKILDFPTIEAFIINNEIALLVIGPEDPLVNGLHDYIEEKFGNKVAVIGPKKSGARLEGSKAFSKAFMQRHNIPTAAYRAFMNTDAEAAKAYIAQHALPIVIKADGLAAGKGVVICHSHAEALETLEVFFTENKFGDAGQQIVIEDFLTGIEASVFVLTNGTQYAVLPEAKDYKRIGEGDTGPNTGGMGSISPVPFMTEAYKKIVKDTIIIPTINGLKAENIPYQGFIFVGLINVNGKPYVIEYNARMGDPETQTVMVRLQTDLVELMAACANNTLDTVPVLANAEAVATVIIAVSGYPEAYSKGNVIENLDALKGSTIFHAGTSLHAGSLVSSGGRVLAITSKAATLAEAVSTSLANAEKLNMPNKYYRKDIGYEFV